MSAITAESARREGAVAPFAVCAAALVGLALLVQLKFGMMADVAWLIDCDERWLAGAVPYRDFLEINPPASLLLYLPAVAVARTLGLPSEAFVTAFGFLAAGATIGLSALILRRGPPIAPSVGLAAIVALILLPGESFGERDHLAAVFGVPFLAATLRRGDGGRPGFALALLAGVGAGLMAAIKPPYALIGVMLALYLVARVGWRAVLRAPEYYAAAAVGLGYLAAVHLLFPEYVAHALPLGVDVYLPLRESLATLLASPGALAILMIAATAVLAAGGDFPNGFVVAALATIGAAVGYVVQGKGWVYQAVPAMMFATLAGGFALERRRAGVPLGAGALAAGLAAPLLHSLGIALAAGVAIGFVVEAALSRNAALNLPRVAPLALAAAIGAACGLCVIERPLTPALERTLAGLGPRLTLGAISEDMGLPFPLARRIGATWAMRSNSLFVTSAVRRRLAERPGDEALRNRLQPYADAEIADLVEDIAVNRPDALLVGPLATRLHAAVWADPRVEAAMTAYTRVAVEERPGYAAELWLRKDFAPKP